MGSLNLKEISAKQEILGPGHRLCAGCGASIALRQVFLACDYPVVVTNATGCVEVATTIYPYTAWKTPWFHSAFENAAASISGIETAFRALKKRGKIPADKQVKFVAIGGDGGTYDIGIQALSGALERGHDFLYICYNNEAYMNTGIQRSSATPLGAATTTSPAGSVLPGKLQHRKDLLAIVAAHHVPYAAQATPGYWRDLMKKTQKAFETKGPTFLNILTPCHRGWRAPVDSAIKLSKLAVDTCVWPLYEIENGKIKITYKPKEKFPVIDWLESQGRFEHLFKPEPKKEIITKIQELVDNQWEYLNTQERCF